MLHLGEGENDCAVEPISERLADRIWLEQGEVAIGVPFLNESDSESVDGQIVRSHRIFRPEFLDLSLQKAQEESLLELPSDVTEDSSTESSIYTDLPSLTDS
jgi:hypothetical protein